MRPSIIFGVLLIFLIGERSVNGKTLAYSSRKPIISSEGKLFYHIQWKPDEPEQPLIISDKENLFGVKYPNNVKSTIAKSAGPNGFTGFVKDNQFGLAVVDNINNCIRLYTDSRDLEVGSCTESGFTDGLADEARFNGPFDIVVAKDVLLITDEFNHAVRQWNSKQNNVTTLLGKSAGLRRPRGIAVDASGTLYITVESGVYSSKTKGLLTGSWSEKGDRDGTLLEARFRFPAGISFLTPDVLAVADFVSKKIKLIDMKEVKVTSLCDVTSTNCTFNYPLSVMPGDNGDLFVSSKGQIEVVKISDQSVKTAPYSNLCYGLKSSGVSTIAVDNVSMQVYCDLDTKGGPWIVLMRRFNGSENFRRNYDDYVNGFGDVRGEYWLGLENIFLLTKSHNAKLRMDLKDFKGKKGFAIYNKFWITNSSDDYRLEGLSDYHGDAGDMETTGRTSIGGPHQGMKFSAYDRDNDINLKESCSGIYNGGWWYRDCFTACLTCGPYRNEAIIDSRNMIYFPFTRRKVGLASADMKIKIPQPDS